MAFSQEEILSERYSFNFENISFYEAFVELSQKTGYHFSYDANYIDSEKAISFSFRDKKLSEIISTLIGKNDFDLKIVGNQIIISRQIAEYSSQDSIVPEIDIYPFVNIRGEIRDVKTNKEVPFATVSITGESIGTISNEDGRFLFKIPKEYENKTISIASMGYESLKLPVSNLDTTFQIYMLKQDYIPIQEVIIRKKEPISLLRSAVEKIPDNFSTKPALYTTFYRETIKRNREYITHSEAILFIYKAPYTNDYSNDLVKVFKSRKTLNVSRLDTFMLKLKGGIETSLILDIAKNPSNLISEENFQFYKYNLSDIILFDEHPTYVIEFEPKVDEDFSLFKGKIFIDVETLGIRGADFSLSQNKLNKATNTMIVKRSKGVKVKALGANYLVKYREVNGKFSLSHIRFETQFRVRKRDKLFGNDFSTITELAVNNIDTADVKRFKYKEVANIGEIFQDQIHTYDLEFWGHLNYLLPDEPLEDALKQIDTILEK